MNRFMTKTKAKWHLLFVKKPKERVRTFELKSIENIKDFVLFHISKYYYNLKSWSKGDSWCNNPEYPKKYRTLIKTYRH